MATVPAADFTRDASNWLAAAEAGEEVVVTRNGAPAVRLTAIGDAATRAAAEEERRAAHRAAVDALFEAGRARRAAGRPGATNAEIISWIKEDQR